MSEQAPETKEKTKRPRHRWVPELLLIAAAFVLLHWWQTHPLASGPAPELSGLSVHGERLDLRELRGRTVLVHFWAEWCPSCRAEQGSIQSIAADYPVITVAMQSGDEVVVRNYLEEASLNLPTLADPQAEIAGDWGVRAVPTSFVVDPEGIISYREVGFTTETGLRTRLWAAGQ